MPVSNSQPLFDFFCEQAIQAGLPLVGGVDIEPAMSSSYFKSHVERFQRWIASGHAGEMSYLSRSPEKRLNPQNYYPEAKAVLSFAKPYSAAPIRGDVQFARYLRGPDYHFSMKETLETILKNVIRHFPDCNGKICVDTSPVLERTWAALCGIGWIGKNTLLIHPKFGSYLLLGEIIINQTLGLLPKLHSNLCGQCMACLKGCPTRALSFEEGLESKKCISYWTLEKRGPIEDPQIKQSLKNWVAGCDVCQEVCPFNFKRASQEEKMHSPFDFPLNYQALEAIDELTYKTQTKKIALNRVKFHDFKRNLMIARQNEGHK